MRIARDSRFLIQNMDLKEKYVKEVAPAMRRRFGYANAMAIPRIEKVTVNVGAGRRRDEKERGEIEKYLALITGQKAAPRRAKKAIAGFQTRQGMVIGYQATLRGRRMDDFLLRLVGAALPRMRDFRGLPVSSFDERGNLTLGIREQTVFPEMIGEDWRVTFGMEVTVVTSAKKREEGIELLKMMGFPIAVKS